MLFSDPLFSKTRHGPSVSMDLLLQGLPEKNVFTGEGLTIEDAEEHACILAYKALKRHPELMQQLQKQANEASLYYNYAADVNQMVRDTPSVLTCSFFPVSFWVIKLAR